ncbi:glycoside hydrolase superfamily [Lactifluus volemus]|nr:glycoside hydrolase superfamily [Lactifluus volemus]
MPIGTRDKGVSLVVPADGSHAVLKANSTLGLFRDLNTFTLFSQLWFTVPGTVYMIGAPVEIQDSPAYLYRGFLLDAARNFFSVSDIERTLDTMSWVHMNTFHWHVVDSQSFPLVVPGFTDMAEKVAYSADAVYTPQNVAHIVSYAGQRGIDVLVVRGIPRLGTKGKEVNVRNRKTPGHTSAISKAYPEQVACADAKPWGTYANEPPAGQLRLASLVTIDFTTSLLSAAAKLFPSTLFATGGDEINTRCYQDDPQQDLAGRMLNEALDVFTQVMHGERTLESTGESDESKGESTKTCGNVRGNDEDARGMFSDRKRTRVERARSMGKAFICDFSCETKDSQKEGECKGSAKEVLHWQCSEQLALARDVARWSHQYNRKCLRRRLKDPSKLKVRSTLRWCAQESRKDAGRVGGVWIPSEDAAAVAAKGFRFIHAASNSFYLDCGAGG